MPAATSAAAFCGFILCSSTPRVVMTTMMGRPVADRTASVRASSSDQDAPEERPTSAIHA